jgi:hypothetical protein
MNPFRKSRQRNAELDAANKYLDETIAKVEEQEPRVNALVSWLEARRVANGFGADIEWTLARPRRARG